jgi:hypothetical protein
MRPSLGLALAIAAAATLFAATPAAARDNAQAAEAPKKTASQRMDAYFEDQRGIAAFRALTGRGDPLIEPHAWWDSGYGASSYETTQRLLAYLLGAEEGAEVAWEITHDCRTDYPLAVLRKRLAAYGDGHPYVGQWMRVQRVVLTACGTGRDDQPTALPPPIRLADPKLAKLQDEDRAYQTAALLFYRDNRPQARARFARIAASASPHKAAAAYMVAAIDAGTRSNPSDSEPRDPARALSNANAILADKSLAAAHPIAQSLIGWVGYNSDDPAARAAQVKVTLDALEAPIARLRSDPVARDRYARALADVGQLHRDFANPAWWLQGSAPPEYHASRAFAARARGDSHAAFLLFPASPFAGSAWAPLEGGLHGESWRTLSEWLETSPGTAQDAPAWRILAAGLAESYDAAAWSEVDAADAQAAAGNEHGLAALPILFYHQIRTALLYGTEAERAAQFETVTERLRTHRWKDATHYSAATGEAVRLLAATGRIADARRLRDMLATEAPDALDGQARELLLLLAEDDEHLVPQLTKDASSVLLERLSTPALARLARRDGLPPEVGARFARTAWARLYALGRPVPADLDRLMRSLNPDLAWTSKPGRIKPTNRAALLDVLRTPGMNILANSRASEIDTAADEKPGLATIDVMNHSDNNWWCAREPERHVEGAEQTLFHTFFGGGDLTNASPHAIYTLRRRLDGLLAGSILWQSSDQTELDALGRLDSAPKFLAERAVAWANKHPRNARAAEALAYAVRATRYGCQRQGGHGAWSRAAFETLHRLHPGTPAAKRTKYWFDCSHFYESCAKPEENDADPVEEAQ